MQNPTQTITSKHRREGGFAVLIVLWVLVLLVLIGDRLILAARTETHVTSNLLQSAEAEAAADGGISEAIYHLMRKPPGGWQAGRAIRYVAIGGDEVAIRIENEALKVNVNTAPLPLLKTTMQGAGLDAEQAASLARAIIDWRTPQTDPSKILELNNIYHLSGRPAGPTFGPFLSIDDLAGVLGMTQDSLVRISNRFTVSGTSTTSPSAPASTAAGAAAGNSPQIYLIRARAGGGNDAGAIFERVAIVQIVLPQKYQILQWSQRTQD